MRVLVVTNMYPSPERPHWGAFVRSQADSLAALGVENRLYEIQGWRGAARYARALAEMPGVVEREQVDLVHAHYGLSGAAAVRVREVPLVISFCGDDLLGRPDGNGRITTMSRALIRTSLLAAERATEVIVKSEEMRRRLPSTVHAEVIPNGVDFDLFAPAAREPARTKLGYEPGESILLFAGAPDEPRKNWTLARQVESRLNARGRKARLVAFHGRPQAELVATMNAADVLLLPSFHEGSPNVVKEAMAVNLPVVSAPVGDCAERLAGVFPGAVVERDLTRFGDAVEAVLADGRRSNGREHLKPLELSNVARRVLAVYERALARGGRG